MFSNITHFEKKPFMNQVLPWIELKFVKKIIENKKFKIMMKKLQKNLSILPQIHQ